ncbi:CAP-Gly domain-containing linker protein 4 isoform X3 [Tachysurus vachellii]|uniref:CAP-Gly domain-containing linker protein 4 isoform X3 n=1 Tax=Tachysurus vachellii TaxID=175792 RepID=UPI00296AEA69|nr:CAP-Gly domain-containing linker protein 4 isoform X3 [Tachysurus vachellii]
MEEPKGRRSEYGIDLKEEMTKEEVLKEPSAEDAVLDQSSVHSHVPARPVIHQVASVPMPSDSDFSFFDPSDPQCRLVLLDPCTTVPELFAVLRQWVPQVQKNIELIGNEILKRGCGVNDRDGLTDMSLLHYCCKAGAPGIGDAEKAASFARKLLSLGADPSLRSRWTNMSALHYAAYFDVPHLIRVVLQASQPGEVDATCSDFDFGTALHIAAANLCTTAVRCLLELGANPAFRNDKGQCPVDVVPEPLDMPLEMADAAAQAKELRMLLRDVLPQPVTPRHLVPGHPFDLHSEKARAHLANIGIHLGDKVVIAGQKVGTLRFCGSTEFAGGLWAGVELQQPEGKNDGSVAGVHYFTCRMKHGIFAPLSKISKFSERRRPVPRRSAAPLRPPRHIDLSRVKSKVDTGALSRSCSTSSSSLDSRQVSALQPPIPAPRQRRPLRPRQERTPSNSRSTPPPSSQCGIWLGIELDKPSGKNDGSVGGVKYFSCPPKHGVFAPPSRVQRIHGSVDCLSELSSSRYNHTLSGMRRSLSTTSAIATQREPNRKTQANRNYLSSTRRRWSSLSHASAAASPRGSGTLGGTVSTSSTDGAVKLHLGMQVLLSSANEMGTIRYFGTADFAPGLWLGLELRSAKGKNDGSVGSRRYFSCRPLHGVLVRPSRVTYRGINGAKLVNESS